MSGELDRFRQAYYSIIGGLRRLGLEQVTTRYLPTNQKGEPVRLNTFGIKSDQSRGTGDPGVVQAAKASISKWRH